MRSAMSSEEDAEPCCIVVGDSGVGKTSLLQTFFEDNFPDTGTN